MAYIQYTEDMLSRYSAMDHDVCDTGITNEIKKSRYDMVVIWARSSLFTAMARFFIRGGGRLLKNYGAIRTRGRCWRRGKNFSSRFFFSFGMSEYAMHE